MLKRIHLVIHAALAILCNPHSGFAQLASQYDLRDVNGLAFVTAVQNQGEIGTCWTWAGMQAVESDLFKEGLLPVTSQRQQPVISAWQMATANGNSQLLEWNPQSGQYMLPDGTLSWGGDMLDTIGYLTRGSGNWNSAGAIPGLTTTEMGGGPVMIQTNPKNAFNLQATFDHLNLSPFVSPANQPMAYLPTSIVDLSFEDRRTSAQANGLAWNQADQVAAVQAAVEKYGAVYTTMYVPAGADFTPYLGPDGWYHYYYNGTAQSNHAVAIVGWDNSLTFEGAPSPGGYIVQNSWGMSWGGNGQGLFYSSYNDSNLGKTGTTAYQFSPMGRFSGLVLQNQIGPNFTTSPQTGAMGLSWSGNSHGDQEAVSVLTNKPSNSYLGAIGVIGQYANQSVQISLYTGMSAGGPTDLLPNETINATLPAPGYFLFNVNPYFLNANQQIVVEVQYLNNALGAFVNSIPAEGELQDVPDGLSYSWNGSRWQDLGPQGEVFFLKGDLLLGLNTYTGAVLGNSYFDYSTGQQVSYIPTTGDFFVNGYAFTNANNVVIHNLQFADAGFLQLSGTLTLSGGSITVDAGTSTVAGGTLSVPGNLDLNGTGMLLVNTNLHVGGQLVIDGATLGVSQQVYVAGNSAIIEKNGALLLDGGAFISDIQNAGKIAGTGTIVGAVSNFGDLVPSVAPGKLIIAGNYLQAATGSLDIEVASPEAYGQLAIVGNAHLGGTLNVLLSSGSKIAYGQIIPDLVTAETVSGSFDKVVMPESFRGRVLEDVTTVSLLVAPASYTQVAHNANQFNVAKGLDGFIAASQGDENVVSGALDHLSAEQFPAAFDAIMPSFYQTASSIGLSMAAAEAQLLDQKIGGQRLDANEGATLRSGSSGSESAGANGKTSIGAPDVTAGPSPSARAEVWFQSEGVFGNRYSVADLPEYRYSSGSFLVGADYQWSRSLKTGLFAGYQAVDARYSGNGHLGVNGVDFGGYVTFDPGDGFYANFIARGGGDGYTAERPIKFGSIDRVAQSDFDSGDGGVFLEGGYDLKLNGWTIGPVANAQYTYLRVTSFTEDNAQSLDLRVGGQEVNSFQTNLGGRVAFTWRSQGGVRIIPEGRIFWDHEYLQGAERVGARLDGGGGSSFVYTTISPARDSALAAIGVNAQLGNRWNVALYYNLEFGSPTAITNIISANIGFNF